VGFHAREGIRTKCRNQKSRSFRFARNEELAVVLRIDLSIRTAEVVRHFGRLSPNSIFGLGGTSGALRRNFTSPAPVAFPARFLKNSAAVSTTPTFSATAIHWFRETASSFARRWAAFLIERGSFDGLRRFAQNPRHWYATKHRLGHE